MPYGQIIFINLPVASLEASVAFYTALGWVKFNTFSNAMATVMSLPMEDSQTSIHASPIKVCLLTHDFFKGFLPRGRELVDPKSNIQAMYCLSAKSREAVDSMIKKAEEAGGVGDVRAKQEHPGGMYGRSFADLDGVCWEVMFMPVEMYEGKE